MAKTAFEPIEQSTIRKFRSIGPNDPYEDEEAEIMRLNGDVDDYSGHDASGGNF